MEDKILKYIEERDSNKLDMSKFQQNLELTQTSPPKPGFYFIEFYWCLQDTTYREFQIQDTYHPN